MGVATGCGFKEIYRFPHTAYPPLVSVLFCSFKKMFFVLVPVLFKNYILGIK